VGVIASIVPTPIPNSPAGRRHFRNEMPGCRHLRAAPRSRKTTFEMVRVMREALKREGAPEDLFQCVEKPSIRSHRN